VFAFAGVTVTTSLLWGIREHLDKAHIGLVYLLLIALVAVLRGTGPAFFASLLAFLAWDYFFLPPVYTLTLSDPRDWILLLTFLAIGILVGQITGRMREREVEAIEREQDTASLYRAILAISTQTQPELVLSRITEQVVHSTNALGSIIFLDSKANLDLISEGEFGDVSFARREEAKFITRWIMQNAKAVGLGPPPEFSAQEQNPWPISVSKDQILPGTGSGSEIYLPLHTREKTIGALIMDPRANQDFTLPQRRLLVAFAAMASTFLEQHRLLDNAMEAAGARETERLKSVLFSSLSHNLKTPLASLTTTLTSLRQEDVGFEPAVVKEQHELMFEDLRRLNEYIDNLLNLSQLESG